jgi:predicted enzyme related to lactoylglutathione lyase
MQVLVNIDVDDLEKAIAFYQAALPLRLMRRLFDGSVAELAGASSRIYLLQQPAGSAAASGAGAVRSYRRHWTPVHLDFAVADLDVAVARATAAGAGLETPLQDFAWGRLATLGDPFGNGFCLVQFHGDFYAGVE